MTLTLFRGRIKDMSTIALHIDIELEHLGIRKPFEIEAWFQRTTNRKLLTGNQMVTWPMTSR